MISNLIFHVDIEFLEEIAMKAQVYTYEDKDMASLLFGDWYGDESFHIFSLNREDYYPPEDPENYPEGQRAYDVIMAIIDHFEFLFSTSVDYSEDYIIVELND